METVDGYTPIRRSSQAGRAEARRMPHQMIYEHIGGHGGFKALRLLWEPTSGYVSLYFHNDREALRMVRPLEEMFEYFDRRAASGPPWDGRVAHAARETLAQLLGVPTADDPSDGGGDPPGFRHVSSA
jgi:hypothetical protein